LVKPRFVLQHIPSGQVEADSGRTSKKEKNMTRMRSLAGALLLTAASASFGQYPSKPIHLIVPFAAGGPTDAIARTLSRALSQSMGQPVVVENRPGAEGQVAAQAVFSSPAEGYVLFVTGSASSAGLGALKKDLGFDPLQLTPVANIASVTFGLFTHPAVPARTVDELVQYARANPGKLNYAVSSNSEFMAAVQLMDATGTQMVKVPYKGSAQAIPELLAGRIQVYFAPLSGERLAYVKDGRLRLLATVSPRRTAFTPDVPTMIEAGLPNVSVPGWNALVGPPKMAGDAVQRLAREVAKASEHPEVRGQLERLMLEVSTSSPQDLQTTMQSDFRLWTEFAKAHLSEADR
jgi:tripartite-type tricarboxylate transporter receptor subunit TctC